MEVKEVRIDGFYVESNKLEIDSLYRVVPIFYKDGTCVISFIKPDFYPFKKDKPINLSKEVLKWGWESLHGNILRDFLFGLLTVLAMHAGRALTALITGTPPEALPLYITTDVITYLFTALIIWIASRPDGVLEDQPHYVRRIAEEENH